MEGSEKTQENKQAVDGMKKEGSIEAAPTAHESAEEGSSRPGRLGRLVPPKYWTELKQLLHLAGPVVRHETHEHFHFHLFLNFKFRNVSLFCV